MSAAEIRQIFYDASTRAALGPGFLPLDNTANERPDWREYWPIRKFFTRCGKTLDENKFYGFLSPKFTDKTALLAPALERFGAAAAPDVDVVIFSPAWDMGALFWNVFEQATFFYPEFTANAQHFTRKIGTAIKLDNVVTDSRNTVFSNYFLAKPRFWRRWLEINNQMFEMTERKNDRIGALLRKQIAYAPHAPKVEFKVFLMERVASLILATTDDFKVEVYKPFELPPSDTVFSQFPAEAIIADALKIAYATTRDEAFRDAFKGLQETVMRQWRSCQAP